MTRPILPPLFRAVVLPLQAFFRLEAASGILLFASAITALFLANSSVGPRYEEALRLDLGFLLGEKAVHFTLLRVVNDGLMTLFFFLVGMEIKRELVRGQLRTPARALLPAVAALGGMLVPAAIYLAFTWGHPGRRGWGIPMATDIAFSIGCLTLLRRRAPHALIVFVTALAIFDDIGGIVVIAVFYGHGVQPTWLAAATGILGLLWILNRMQVRSASWYLVGGAALWWTFHAAGIHATIAGVALGAAVPSRCRREPREVLTEMGVHTATLLNRPADEAIDTAAVADIEDRLEDLVSPLDRFVRVLHPWVAFGVMPLFALANSGVSVRGASMADLLSPVTLGTAIGLFIGKQLGIFLFSLLPIGLRLTPRPGEASLVKLYGVGIVAGIGFTVGLFIASLAFDGEPRLLMQAKIGILAGSVVSGVVGALFLRATRPAN